MVERKMQKKEFACNILAIRSNIIISSRRKKKKASQNKTGTSGKLLVETITSKTTTLINVYGF